MLDTYPESHQVIGEIFAALTFAQLHELALTAATPWTIPLVWPRVEFRRCPPRSSFPTHLHVLELRNVCPHGTGAESNVYQPFPASSNEDPVETLITDTLLAALTHPRLSNSAPLVPAALHIQCHTGSFRCEMYFLLGYGRELDPCVIAQIDEQRIQKRLNVHF
ncbi:hypothetical protein B0H14DRAFT_3508075 [Mycena olivaceomarginata]|nr:hypothetical protein B0H14DRAFT_3508075 [Mycena olivaceomarginata]